MSIMPVETEVVFECHVCASTHIKVPTKYNCSNCEKKICDICFVRHIITKRNCVFCRAPLIIEDVNHGTIIINIHPELSPTSAIFVAGERQVCIHFPKSMWLLINICCIWYIFLFIWLFYLSPR